MVVESLVAVLDRIVSRLDRKVASRRAVFIDQIEPVFDDVIHIHEDYMNIFREVREAASCAQTDREKADNLRLLITNRRLDMAVVREKVSVLSDVLRSKKNWPAEAALFFDSVWSYFHISSGEDPSRVESGSSTLMHAFEHIESERRTNRPSILTHLSSVEAHLESCWFLILKSYAQARVALLK